MDIQFVEGNNFKIKTKNANLTTSPFVVGEKTLYGPGEYEISNVSVMSFRLEDSSVVSIIEADRLSLVYLGDSKAKLSNSLIDEIGDCDVAIALTKESFDEALRLEPFFIIVTDEQIAKDAGYTPESMNKFSVKKEDINTEMNTKVLVLTAK